MTDDVKCAGFAGRERLFFFVQIASVFKIHRIKFIVKDDNPKKRHGWGLDFKCLVQYCGEGGAKEKKKQEYREVSFQFYGTVTHNGSLQLYFKAKENNKKSRFPKRRMFFHSICCSTFLQCKVVKFTHPIYSLNLNIFAVLYFLSAS